MWFENLTGFPETSAEEVRSRLTITGSVLRSTINGKTFDCGTLEIPTLGELRTRIDAIDLPLGNILVREVIANVQDLHTDISNAGSLFQVASQFNLLEMASPESTPESGVGIYENDYTQGPSCAISAGAGTIYRNYFTEINGQQGQTVHKQIDCLADIGQALGNKDNCLWKMVNGYALASKGGLLEINNIIKNSNESEISVLRNLLRIGVHWNTQVTLNDSKHTVSQAYCSALPVAYSNSPSALWSTFAGIILDATYEATICAAVNNYHRTNNNTLYLTLIGGGVFGNKIEWIIAAIRRSLKLYRHIGLDVAIVSHSKSNEYIQEMIKQDFI